MATFFMGFRRLIGTSGVLPILSRTEAIAGLLDAGDGVMVHSAFWCPSRKTGTQQDQFSTISVEYNITAGQTTHIIVLAWDRAADHA
jgi:hypothetical protein